MGFNLGVYDSVRFPYEVFRDADYARSSEVVVRQLTDEERLLYMSTAADKLQEVDLLGNEPAHVLAKRYGVSPSTIRRARVKLRAERAEANNTDEVLAVDPVIVDPVKPVTVDRVESVDPVEEEVFGDVESCWDYLSRRLKEKQDFVVRVLGSNLYEPVDWELQRAIDLLIQE